jgi:hypothetical protein
MMKKTLFSLMTIALMAVVCVGFSACGSDGDDNGGGSSSGLTGVWKRTYKYEIKYTKDASGQWVKSSEKEKTYGDNDGSEGYLFESGGMAKLLYNVLADGTYKVEEEFKYKVEGGHLYMWELDDRDEDGWEDVGKITVSGNTFEMQEEEIDGNYKKVSTKRYKKVM